MEEWKDIKGYEGLYKISNLGRVKSLSRLINHPNGRKRLIKEIILKDRINTSGYVHVGLYKNGVQNSKRVHKLVAIHFLNHTPDGMTLVINHKDFNKLNNNVDNLEVITPRENGNLKHIKSSSKYVGVSYVKKCNKWRAYIVIKGKQKHLGYFNNEEKASLAYKEQLKALL